MECAAWGLASYERRLWYGISMAWDWVIASLSGSIMTRSRWIGTSGVLTCTCSYGMNGLG